MYGEVIKQIRLNKNLTLKAVYLDVCSKTNAIKFEQGLRILAADKFNHVLENLMITMNEFQWIQNGYQPNPEHYYEYMISNTWNSNQITAFQQQLHNLEKTPQSIKRVQLASYRSLQNYQKKLAPAPKELVIIINYFSNLSTWTLSDVRFFANNCSVLPYSLMKNLLHEALKVQDRYQYYRDSDQIFAIVLSNCLDVMITNADYAAASKTLTLLKQQTQNITMGTFKLFEKYYEAKLDFLHFNKQKGLAELKQVQNVAAFLENKQLIGEIQALIANPIINPNQNSK
ncbi:hypothetical protein MOO45_07385 [Bombilactobacillus folatiphilus]|uniref:HTH-type transcriptional regulator Rgg C-terminal domain-containing protein n=1 Tax=Bombilactobacillus folatiphilus TaxID=2923362 RepID=A0ABY4P8V1_9LACO|nr:hypothetical protein [Bombilactobacillus folatiphilus]UQS82004.1 hypothetical protein MOO45_07385 [Bombilactobacillus folatiphilus]